MESVQPSTLTMRRPASGVAAGGETPLLGPELLACLRDGDFEALERLLAPNVWLRGLLVRTAHETYGAREAVEAFRKWSHSAHGREMVDGDHHRMAEREFIRYRFLLCPAWAPGVWHLIEQSGYLRVRDGRISRLDLVCTGYHAVDDAEAARLLAAAGRS